MCLEIFEDGFYIPFKINTSRTSKRVTLTSKLLSIALRVKQQTTTNVVCFFIFPFTFKRNALHTIPESRAFRPSKMRAPVTAH